MKSILFAAAVLVTQSAFAQIQVVSLATLDPIDVDHMPTLAPTKSTACECGCVEGALCTCTDCPAKAKTIPVSIVALRSKLLPDGSPDTLAPGIEKMFAVVDTSQSPPVPTYSQRPAPKKQAAQGVNVGSIVRYVARSRAVSNARVTWVGAPGSRVSGYVHLMVLSPYGLDQYAAQYVREDQTGQSGNSWHIAPPFVPLPMGDPLTTYSYSGDSCAGGSCGTTRRGGRRGLFGWRR